MDGGTNHVLDKKLDGTILYFDLDVVICRNIDNLFTYNPICFVYVEILRSLRYD